MRVVHWAVPFALGCAALVTVPPSPSQIDAAPRGRTIHPRAVAVNANTHRVYAVDQDGDRVLMMDSAGAISSIAVGKAPNAIAIDAAANRIYVVNAGSGNVSVIDGATERVVSTVPTDARPYAIAADPSLHRVYVTNTFSNKVTVIDGVTNTASQMSLGSQDFVEVDAHRQQAFLFSYENPALTRLDATGAVHREQLALRHPWGLTVDVQHGIVYITEIGDHMLIAFHEDDGKTMKVNTGSMPDAVAVDTAENRVYVANYVDDTLTVVDGATMQVLATLPVGKHPQAVAVDGTRHRVFVANTHSDNVTVIDGKTNRVLATVSAGTNPYAITVDAESGDAFAADYGPHPLTKLDLSNLGR